MTATYRIRAEIAFTTQPLAATPVFQDISQYLLAGNGKTVSIKRGRGDEFSTIQPSTLSMSLDNSDGRFTPGLVTSPYYPNVKKGRRLRVTVRPWDNTNNRPLNAGNLVTNPGAEVNTTGWSGANATLARTTTAGQFNSGAAGFQFTVTTGAVLAGLVSGVTVPVVGGRAYAFAAQLKKAVNTRNGALRVQFYKADGVTVTGSVQVGGSVSVTTAAFTRATLAVTAPSDAAFATVQPGTAATGDAVAAEVWFVDDVQVDEGASAGTFTTTAPDIYYRFDGFVDQWPQQWLGSAALYAEATITATDRLARLAKGRTLDSIIAETITALSPNVYWKLNETTGTTFAPTDSNAGGPFTVTQLPAELGGAFTPGGATGPDTDGDSAPLFAPSTSSNGFFLSAPIAMATPPAGAFSISFYFTWATNAVYVLSNSAQLQVAVSGSQIDIKITQNDNTSLNTSLTGPTVNDGAVHCFTITASGVTSGSNVKFYIDGTQVSTTKVVNASGLRLLPADFRIGADQDSSTPKLWAGSVAHLAVFGYELTAAQVTSLASLRTKATAGDGESSDARISRWATYLGITSTSLEAGVSTSVQFRDWTSQSPLALMQEVERTEGGMLFFDGQGRLVFQARSHRYNPSPVATLAAGQYSDDLLFRLDDFLLANDVRITKNGGSTFRSVNPTSQADYDTYVVTDTSISTNDNEVASAAQWRVNQYGTPLLRCPQVSVDLLTQPTLIPTVGGAELGSLLRLAGLPTTAPATTVDLFVEAIEETISVDTWLVKFTTSPLVPSGAVWVLDSSTYSVLDTSTVLAY